MMNSIPGDTKAKIGFKQLLGFGGKFRWRLPSSRTAKAHQVVMLLSLPLSG